MTVFYVDDDQDDIEIFTEAVDSLGRSVQLHTFTSGADAIQRMKEICPDHIFLDYHLPQMTSTEFLLELRNGQCFEDTKVIMYSAFMFKEDIDACKKLGISDYIAKPGTLAEVVALLETVLFAI